MTTPETLTTEQVEALLREAQTAGDPETIADCELWLALPFPLLSVPGLDAAERIAAVIRNCEAQQ